MIDRIMELQMIDHQKSIKAQIPSKMPKHGYVGVYEDFLKA
jgi:hypothetical protein